MIRVCDIGYGILIGGWSMSVVRQEWEWALWGLIVGLILATVNWYASAIAEKHYLKDK